MEGRNLLTLMRWGQGTVCVCDEVTSAVGVVRHKLDGEDMVVEDVVVRYGVGR